MLVGREEYWIDETIDHFNRRTSTGIFITHCEFAYMKRSKHILFDSVNGPDQVEDFSTIPATGMG